MPLAQRLHRGIVRRASSAVRRKHRALHLAAYVCVWPVASFATPAIEWSLLGAQRTKKRVGLSADGIFGLDYFTYNYPPSPSPFIADGYIQGCVTPGPACELATTPVPSTWLLLLGGLVGLGFLLIAGRRQALVLSQPPDQSTDFGEAASRRCFYVRRSCCSA
jgi:hypothetical protein